MKRQMIVWMLVTAALCLALIGVGWQLYEMRQEMQRMRRSIDQAIDELYYPGMWLFLDDEPTENVEAFG